MVKNKKIKKLFSVICTVLTLNFTSSIFQHNPSAIKFETTTDDDDWESTSVTLDKPFHCIVVYDKPEITYQGQTTTWNKIPLADLLFETAPEEKTPNIETLYVSAQEYINNMQEFLNRVSDEDELLIVVCLNQTSHWDKLPTLPYSYMLGTQQDINCIINKLPGNLGDTPLRHLVFSQDGTTQLTTLELSRYPDSPPRIRSYEILASGQYHLNFDPFVSSYWKRPAFWHLKAPERIMSVKQLKAWLATHNPDLLEQSELKNQKPSSNKPHINPTPALYNDENEAHGNSGFTPTNEYNFELDDFDIPLVDDLMNDAGYNEEIIPTKPSTYYPYIGEPESYYNENELKTTIFSKTKKFVHKNPKTSVGIGAAIITLGGTIIYKIKKLFTRESKKSQANNQINQKYNQYVKNKV